MMSLTKAELNNFESGLNPLQLKQSKIPAEVIGYGEISTVFEIQGDNHNAYKRLPLFDNHKLAEDYQRFIIHIVII